MLRKKSSSKNSEGVGRREFFAASGMAVAGASFLGVPGGGQRALAKTEACIPVRALPLPEGPVRTPGITEEKGGAKPVYLPEAGVANLASFAVAESLFWTDIMMEHAFFFSLLMPGERLKAEREEAQRYQAAFAHEFLRLRDSLWDVASFSAWSPGVRKLLQAFIEFKLRMRARQEKGDLKSLVWPLFFEHTTHEAQQFLARLEQISRGSASLKYAHVVSFWTEIMAEHGDFIAHLLDPTERALIAQAQATAENLRGLHDLGVNAAYDDLRVSAQEMIDFKTAAEQGIEAGKLKSIIDPALADHVRREAVKFSYELKLLGSA